MTHTPGPWEQWKVQAYRHLGAAGDGITEVELIGLPGYLREWKPWPACISAIAQYIAYHLNFREGESRYVTVQGKETE